MGGKVTELMYMGFLLKYVENKGWKITIGDYDYLFPYMTAAQYAVRQIHKDLFLKHNAERSPSWQNKRSQVEYSMEHHRPDPDPFPITKDQTPLFVNEPWLTDRSLLDAYRRREPDEQEDNIRIYVPLDLNHDSILRRLDQVVRERGSATEKNESEYRTDIRMLIWQIEIYDRIWYNRCIPEKGNHSAEGIALVKDFVARLEDIPDGCAELFPFDEIEKLTEEYLTKPIVSPTSLHSTED